MKDAMNVDELLILNYRLVNWSHILLATRCTVLYDLLHMLLSSLI